MLLTIFNNSLGEGPQCAMMIATASRSRVRSICRNLQDGEKDRSNLLIWQSLEWKSGCK